MKILQKSNFVKFIIRLQSLNQITPNQMKILINLTLTSENYNPTQTQISKESGIARSHVSRAIKQLIDKNLIQKAGQFSFNGKRSTPIYELTSNIEGLFIDYIKSMKLERQDNLIENESKQLESFNKKRAKRGLPPVEKR